MKISAIRYSVPSRRLNNEELVSLLINDSLSLPETEKKEYFRRVLKLLHKSGAQYRYLRNLDSKESAYEHIISCAQRVLADAHAAPSQVDLLIFCGVGKGLIEPSNAYCYASELGMSSAECFDISDACMSWVRSLEIAQYYLSSGRAKKVMVLTGEFHLNIRSPQDVRDIESLRYNFPGYTIGEAATATLLEPSKKKWDFTYASRPDHFDLCTIPLNGYETYLPKNHKIGINGEGCFVSFGNELIYQATLILQELVNQNISDRDDIDLFIPHAPSTTAYYKGFKELKLPIDKLFLQVFKEFGNIVSSSLPVGIREAMDREVIKEGSRICLIPASAGISCACVTFEL